MARRRQAHAPLADSSPAFRVPESAGRDSVRGGTWTAERSAVFWCSAHSWSGSSASSRMFPAGPKPQGYGPGAGRRSPSFAGSGLRLPGFTAGSRAGVHSASCGVHHTLAWPGCLPATATRILRTCYAPVRRMCSVCRLRIGTDDQTLIGTASETHSAPVERGRYWCHAPAGAHLFARDWHSMTLCLRCVRHPLRSWRTNDPMRADRFRDVLPRGDRYECVATGSDRS